MKTQLITTTELAHLGVAYSLMRDHEIRHLPVLRDGRLCGLLSERDILGYRARAEADEDWWRDLVKDAMSSPPQTAGPDDSVTEAAGRLAAARIGALPIVDCGHLIGLVTTTDVLEAEVRRAMGSRNDTNHAVVVTTGSGQDPRRAS